MNTETADKTPNTELPALFVKGFCMGSADVVPGVSGGTMALILGIYTRLIDAIKSVNAVFLGHITRFRLTEAFRVFHWKFLAVVLAGIFTAVMFFTRVVKLPVLMDTHPEIVYGLFFGLIVGSIWFVGRDAGTFDLKMAAWVFLGTLTGLRVVTLLPADTPEHALFVFLSGAIAITAMILPGISGSFILLILRKYAYILEQFGKLGTAETGDAVLVLLPFGLGMVTGIMLFSRVLSWLLHHYRKETYSVLTGFMTGSLWVIWPWQNRVYEFIGDKERLIQSIPVFPDTGSPEFLWGAGMGVLGLAVVLLIEWYGKRKTA